MGLKAIFADFVALGFFSASPLRVPLRFNLRLRPHTTMLLRNRMDGRQMNLPLKTRPVRRLEARPVSILWGKLLLLRRINQERLPIPVSRT